MLDTASPVLKAQGLEKSFGRRQVVRGVDLEVRRGEIVGFLGPNGAGKTTVMKMITGLLSPGAGEIALFGLPEGFCDPAVRARIGYLQEKPRIYPEMNARSYLGFFAGLYRIGGARRRIEQALSRVGLADVGRRPLGAFSRGMQQRLCLARCLLHAPEFLVLDEPTLGLDPNGVIDMRNIFLSLRESGVALLFSSHQLAEMERVTDRIVLLSAGEVVAAGDKQTVLAGGVGKGGLMVETARPARELVEAVRRLDMVVDAQVRQDHELALILRPETGIGDRERRARLVEALVAVGVTPLSVRSREITLEELFVQMTAPTRPGVEWKQIPVN